MDNEILLKIKNGLSYGELKTSYNVSYKQLYNLAKKNLLLDFFKKNNQIYKKKCISKIANDKLVKKIDELDHLYGSKLESMVYKGYNLNQILNELKDIPIKKINLLLKHRNLYNKRIQNSRTLISNLARENGKISSFTLKGKELKPISKEISERFLKLKEVFLYKQKVYDKLKEEFNFGEKKCKQLCEKYGYPLNNPQTGNLNPMFGKSPGRNAGVGVKCWILVNGNYLFCRSSLELRIMCYLYENNINFQISKHRIKYFNKVQRTYCPDIVIDSTIYEIKPYNMLQILENKIKLEALKNYCEVFKLKFGILTEKTFNLEKYNFEFIINLKNKNMILIDQKNEEKLRRNIL